MGNDMPRNLIWKHVCDIETCMMVTYTGNTMHGRPMRGIARPEHNTVWFFTDTDTHKDDELQKDPRACLTYADLKSHSFVSLSGIIARILDTDTIEHLWNEAAQLYFPNGPSDPKVVLLRFQPEVGQYWDSPSSAIVLAIKFLEAKISGEQPNLGNTGSAKLS